MSSRKRVFVCSPLAANEQWDFYKNLEYARRCCEDSVRRGEAPFAPHLLYTRFMNDDVPAQREASISCGSEWLRVAELLALYLDHGHSPGMKDEEQLAREHGIPIEQRTIIV